MTTTSTTATFEATLAQDAETGNVTISLYRSIPAGICGPWGTLDMADTGCRTMPLAAADAGLAAGGYRRTGEWQIRGTYQGLSLVAEVTPTV